MEESRCEGEDVVRHRSRFLACGTIGTHGSGYMVVFGVFFERTGREEMKQKMVHTLATQGPVLCNCRFLSILIVPCEIVSSDKQWRDTFRT